MSIMDIGILTGFAPDKKSLEKVSIVLLYLQRILNLFLDISFPGDVFLPEKLTSTQCNPKEKIVISRGLFL